MVYPAELPQVEPRWHRRPLVASEVLRVVNGEDVPGLDPTDARVQAMRRCVLGNLGRLAFHEARERSFLRYVTDLPGQAVTGDTVAAWGWWCAAARHPEIVLHVSQRTDRTRLTCDLSSSGKVLQAGAMIAIGRAIAETHTEDDWLLTRETVEVGGLDNESALGLAETLLAVVHDRRLTVDTAWAPKQATPPQ